MSKQAEKAGNENNLYWNIPQQKSPPLLPCTRVTRLRLMRRLAKIPSSALFVRLHLQNTQAQNPNVLFTNLQIGKVYKSNFLTTERGPSPLRNRNAKRGLKFLSGTKRKRSNATNWGYCHPFNRATTCNNRREAPGLNPNSRTYRYGCCRELHHG